MKDRILQGPNGKAHLRRNAHGVPVITADSHEDLFFAIGYAHACDRLVQMMLVRELARGRASEKFSGSKELIEIDKFMRRVDFCHKVEEEVQKIDEKAKAELEAYCAGVNYYMKKHWRPLEFWITFYKPDPWTPEDSLITVRIMGYLGLAQMQGDVEKFIIQLIQADLPEDKLRALFPSITDEIDYELIRRIKLQDTSIPKNMFETVLPVPRASNNWVVHASKSASGNALAASDPHLEVNRLPAIWYEMVWHLGEERIMGITMPGLPIMVMGRTNRLCWSGTYGFMDMIDFFIEEVKDEKYLYDGQWYFFEKREEIIKPKGKKEIRLTFYENHHGVLEGDASRAGKYLSMAFSGREDAGADIFNNLMHPEKLGTVQDAQRVFRNLKMPTFNWLFADSSGNIGYQMNGKMPKRAEGFSGLIPIPGWKSANDWQGFVEPDQLPTRLNPDTGYLGTANNDMNAFGQVKPINLAMAPYRVNRISQMLEEGGQCDTELFRKMHFDLYSLQAERLMEIVRPLLPETENGNLLKEWDMRYTPAAVEPTLFESIYRQMVLETFATENIGEAVVEYMLNETSLFTAYYGYFDDVLTDEQSPWFTGRSSEEVLRRAIERGLNIQPQVYRDTRRFDMLNIFFMGSLPGFLGFDRKGIILQGSRATIPQGQMFRTGGLNSSFAPSWRMVMDFAAEGIETNLPGGPSGSRFSKWYTTDLRNWIEGNYKKLS